MKNKNYMITVEEAIKDTDSIVGFYWETVDTLGVFTKKQAEMVMRDKKKYINNLSGLVQNTMIKRRYELYELGENCILENTKSFGTILREYKTEV